MDGFFISLPLEGKGDREAVDEVDDALASQACCKATNAISGVARHNAASQLHLISHLRRQLPLKGKPHVGATLAVARPR